MSARESKQTPTQLAVGRFLSGDPSSRAIQNKLDGLDEFLPLLSKLAPVLSTDARAFDTLVQDHNLAELVQDFGRAAVVQHLGTEVNQWMTRHAGSLPSAQDPAEFAEFAETPTPSGGAETQGDWLNASFNLGSEGSEDEQEEDMGDASASPVTTDFGFGASFEPEEEDAGTDNDQQQVSELEREFFQRFERTAPASRGPPASESMVFIDQELLDRAMKPITAAQPSARTTAAPASESTRAAGGAGFVASARPRTSSAFAAEGKNAPAPSSSFVPSASRRRTPPASRSRRPTTERAEKQDAFATLPTSQAQKTTKAQTAARVAATKRAAAAAAAVRTGAAGAGTGAGADAGGGTWWKNICFSGGPEKQSFRAPDGRAISQARLPAVLAEAGISAKHPCGRDSTVIVVPDSASTASDTQQSKSTTSGPLRVYRWSDYVDAISDASVRSQLQQLTRVLPASERQPPIRNV